MNRGGSGIAGVLSRFARIVRPETRTYSVFLNGKEIGRIRMMESKVEEGIVGYLFSRGFIRDTSPIEEIRVEGTDVFVEGDPEMEYPVEYPREDLPSLSSRFCVEKDLLLALPAIKNYGLFLNGEMYVIREENRKALLYKLVGTGLMRGMNIRESLILTDALISEEFVTVTARLGVPVIGSDRGVSSGAIRLARKTNQTLFIRRGSWVAPVTASYRIM